MDVLCDSIFVEPDILIINWKGKCKMRFRVILLFCVVVGLVYANSFAHDLQTPRGTNVYHDHCSATDCFHGHTAEYWDADWLNWCGSGEIIAHSNCAYDCHGYAWNGADPGNANSWCMGNWGPYIDDGSFVEIGEGTAMDVCTQTTVIVLYGGSTGHSAILINDQPEVISKWSWGPLCQEPLVGGYVQPDPELTIKYYARATDTPILTYPSEGTTFPMGTNVTFTWNPVEGAEYYILNGQWEYEVNGEWSYGNFGGTVYGPSYTYNMWLSDGTYYWTVTAVGPVQTATSEWRTIFSHY